MTSGFKHIVALPTEPRRQISEYEEILEGEKNITEKYNPTKV